MKLIALSLTTLGMLCSCTTYNISVRPEQKKTSSSTNAAKPTSKPKATTKPTASTPAASNSNQNSVLVEGRRVFDEDPLKLEPAKSVQLEVNSDRQ